MTHHQPRRLTVVEWQPSCSISKISSRNGFLRHSRAALDLAGKFRAFMLVTGSCSTTDFLRRDVAFQKLGFVVTLANSRNPISAFSGLKILPPLLVNFFTSIGCSGLVPRLQHRTFKLGLELMRDDDF